MIHTKAASASSSIGIASSKCAGMYRRFVPIALGLNWIKPGWYPDFSGPPYTRSLKTARPAPNTTMEPSHQASATVGTFRSRQATATATAAQPSTTMSV